MLYMGNKESKGGGKDLSIHVSTVYWGHCEKCGKKSPFKVSADAARSWERTHLYRKHKITMTIAQQRNVKQVTLEPQKVEEGGKI